MNEANQITNNTRLYGFIAEEAQQNRFSVVLNKRFKTDAIDGHEAMMIPMNIRPDDFYFTVANMKNSKLNGAVLGSEYQKDVLELLDGSSREVELCGACDTLIVSEGKLHGSLLCGKAVERYLKEQGAAKVALIGTGAVAKAYALASSAELSYFDANIEALMQMSQALGLGDIDINRCAEGMAVELSGFDAVVVSEDVSDLSMLTGLPKVSVDLKSAKNVSALRQRCAELGSDYSGYEALLDDYCATAYNFFKSEKETA